MNEERKSRMIRKRKPHQLPLKAGHSNFPQLRSIYLERNTLDNLVSASTLIPSWSVRVVVEAGKHDSNIFSSHMLLGCHINYKAIRSHITESLKYSIVNGNDAEDERSPHDRTSPQAKAVHRTNNNS